MKSIHVTVGRPGNRKANGVLQTVFAFLENSASGRDQVNFYMSKKIRGKSEKYFRFSYSIIGVISCFHAIYKSRKEINKIYFYGGCQWRFLIMIILIRFLVNKHFIVVWVPSGAYSTNSYFKRALWKQWFVKHIEFRILSWVQFIQALSAQERKQMKLHLPSNLHSKIVIIPNAISPPNSPLKSRRLNFGKNVKILYIGRKDVVNKGLAIVAQAIKNLKNSGMSIEFNIYGPTPHRNDEAQLQQIVNSSNGLVRSFPAIYGLEKERIFFEHDIFILASKSEGLPTALVEAAQTGILCLATPETNLEKDDFRAGVKKIKYHSNSIAKEILLVAKNKRRKSDVSKQVIHFKNKFNFENIRQLHDVTFKN